MTVPTSDPQRRALLGRALSLAAAVAPFGVAFGVMCTQAGLSPLIAVGFSTLVFTGSAQLAAVAVLGGGGTVAAAVIAGLLLNLRCLAFGVLMAPVFPRSWTRRALAAQLMIDESTAVATSTDDPDLRWFGYLAGGIGVFVSWNLSTLAGAVLVPGTGTLVEDLGIDATIPAAFLALLWPRLRDPLQRWVALGGASIALALVPVLPAGLPIIAAGMAVPVALRFTRRSSQDPESSDPSVHDPESQDPTSRTQT
jgi:predicted branched-subunit amino acid permease